MEEIPTTLNEALDFLEQELTPEYREKIRQMGEDQFIVSIHHVGGRTMRNDWGLWSGSKLKTFFEERGIIHPDDMSGLIFAAFHRKICGKPLDLKGIYKHYLNHWDQWDPDLADKMRSAPKVAELIEQ